MKISNFILSDFLVSSEKKTIFFLSGIIDKKVNLLETFFLVCVFFVRVI